VAEENKVSKIEEARDYFTGELSKAVRQLDLAGLGILWIIRVGGKDAAGIVFDKFLLWPMLGLALSLLCDFCHYAYGSFIWDQQAQLGSESTMHRKESLRLGKVGRFFFWAKTVLCGAAFVLLTGYIGAALFR
jgi:hypothetical protein